MLLTTVRDIPLDPPPPVQYIPPWNYSTAEPKLLPHAEPVG